MKISEVIDILDKYQEEYGDLNVALISNIGEQNVVSAIDVVSFYDGSDPTIEPENIVVFKDKFNYNQFNGAEFDGYPDDKDWDNGYPGYEITEKEIEDPDSDYFDSGCPIEDKEDTDGWIPWDLM